MNQAHLERCASDEWADTVQRHIIPWVLEGIELGDDVLEIGPGPGRTTEVLKDMAPQLTALEIDEDLAAALAARLAGTNVEVVRGDGTAMPFRDARFSHALSFTMLHHVPTPALQDRLLAEAARILRPGGVLAGVDGLASDELRDLHVDDTYVPLDPATLPARLERAGFTEVDVETNEFAVRFRGRVP